MKKFSLKEFQESKRKIKKSSFGFGPAIVNERLTEIEKKDNPFLEYVFIYKGDYVIEASSEERDRTFYSAKVGKDYIQEYDLIRCEESLYQIYLEEEEEEEEEKYPLGMESWIHTFHHISRYIGCCDSCHPLIEACDGYEAEMTFTEELTTKFEYVCADVKWEKENGYYQLLEEFLEDEFNPKAYFTVNVTKTIHFKQIVVARSESKAEKLAEKIKEPNKDSTEMVTTIEFDLKKEKTLPFGKEPLN